MHYLQNVYINEFTGYYKSGPAAGVYSNKHKLTPSLDRWFCLFVLSNPSSTIYLNAADGDFILPT